MELFSHIVFQDFLIILWLNFIILSTNYKISEARSQQQQEMFEHSEPVQTNHMCRGPWQWLCEDGIECIAQYDVCDGITQCSDHSDEKNCYNKPNENFHSLFNGENQNFDHKPNSKQSANSSVKIMPTMTIASLQTKEMPLQTSPKKSNLQMKFLFGGLSIFVFIAFIVHIALKRRRSLNDSVRGFRKGESLVEDEDDLLISQMYA